MHSTRDNVPVSVETPEVRLRSTEWGGMAIETGVCLQTIDATPLFAGLPDDKCQCPHWGYVIKGSIRFHFAGRVDTFSAGEIYYAEPGHTPELVEGLEYVEFSPADELAKTTEQVGKNMAAMMSGAQP